MGPHVTDLSPTWIDLCGYMRAEIEGVASGFLAVRPGMGPGGFVQTALAEHRELDRAERATEQLLLSKSTTFEELPVFEELGKPKTKLTKLKSGVVANSGTNVENYRHDGPAPSKTSKTSIIPSPAVQVSVGTGQPQPAQTLLTLTPTAKNGGKTRNGSNSSDQDDQDKGAAKSKNQSLLSVDQDKEAAKVFYQSPGPKKRAEKRSASASVPHSHSGASTPRGGKHSPHVAPCLIDPRRFN